MTTLIIAIHGNGGTFSAWNYVKTQVTNFDHWVDLEYDSAKGFTTNLARMKDELHKLTEQDSNTKLFFVAHSLGSVYAIYLAAAYEEFTIGGITVAPPFLGSEAAITLNYIAPSQIYKDIMPFSPVITGLQKLTVPKKFKSVVTLLGRSKLISGQNDGVLTRESMIGLKGLQYIGVESNHGEVLLSRKVCDIINVTLTELEENV